MFTFLAQYSLRRTKRFFEKDRTAKVFTLLGFVLAFAFLGVVVYFGFRSGFRHIVKDAFFGDALFLYISELFLLVSFLLVVASALISVVASLFRGAEDTLLIASPRHTWKPFIVFSRMFLSSLWPLLVLILPALFAMERVYGFSYAELSVVLCSVILLIALGVLFAMALAFAVAWALYFLGGRSARLLTPRNFIGLTAVLFVGKLLWLWKYLATIDLLRFFQARSLDVTTPDLSPIIEQFHSFPTHLSAMTMYLARVDDVAAAATALFHLAFLLLVVLVGVFILGRHHLILWELFQERRGMRARSFIAPFLGGAVVTLARTPERALIGKEMIAFFSNARGLLWFGFIILIWFMQVGAGKIVARGLGAERVSAETLPAFVSVFQFAVILYFVSMFVLRFAFPSFSAERRGAWILAAAPLDLGAVFLAKLRFFVSLFSIIALGFGVIHLTVSTPALSLSLLLLFTLLLGTLFLTTYGLALGALYPNFASDDPEVLSTTLPGLGFIFGALAYGALGAYALGELFRSTSTLPFLVFAAVSLFLTAYFARRARRALSLMEFA